MIPEGYIVHSPLLNSYGLVIGNKAFEPNFENDNNDLNKEVESSCDNQPAQIWDLASYSVNLVRFLNFQSTAILFINTSDDVDPTYCLVQLLFTGMKSSITSKLALDQFTGI
jgi:hypothetical protein